MANYEIETITRAKQNERNVRTKLRKYSPTICCIWKRGCFAIK